MTKARLTALFAIPFLAFWTYFMVSAFGSAKCHNLIYPAQDRLAACKRGDARLGFLMTDAQRAGNAFWQGLALAELGQTEEARTAFARSFLLKWQAAGQSLPRFERFVAEDLRQLAAPSVTEEAREIWHDALKDPRPR